MSNGLVSIHESAVARCQRPVSGWAREQRVINNRSLPCLKFIAARTHFSGADPRANVMASRAARSPSSPAASAFITLLAFVIVGRTGAQHEEA